MIGCGERQDDLALPLRASRDFPHQAGRIDAFALMPVTPVAMKIGSMYRRHPRLNDIVQNGPAVLQFGVRRPGNQAEAILIVRLGAAGRVVRQFDHMGSSAQCRLRA